MSIFTSLHFPNKSSLTVVSLPPTKNLNKVQLTLLYIIALSDYRAWSTLISSCCCYFCDWTFSCMTCSMNLLVSSRICAVDPVMKTLSALSVMADSPLAARSLCKSLMTPGDVRCANHSGLLALLNRRMARVFLGTSCGDPAIAG